MFFSSYPTTQRPPFLSDLNLSSTHSVHTHTLLHSFCQSLLLFCSLSFDSINGKLGSLSDTTIRRVGQMSSADDESIGAHAISSITVNLGLARVDVLEGLSLEWITESNCNLCKSHQLWFEHLIYIPSKVTE